MRLYLRVWLRLSGTAADAGPPIQAVVKTHRDLYLDADFHIMLSGRDADVGPHIKAVRKTHRDLYLDSHLSL